MPLGWGSSHYPHTPGISRWYPVGIRLGRAGRFGSLRSLNERGRGQMAAAMSVWAKSSPLNSSAAPRLRASAYE